MKKSAIYEMVIEAVIESQFMELDSKVIALEMLFEELGTVRFGEELKERKEKEKGETA